MLLFRLLLLPVLANAIPAFAVEAKKFRTVISEDSYKHNVFSTQRALQAETECTDDPPDWAADYYDYEYDCGSFQSSLDYDYDYEIVCKTNFKAKLTDSENGFTVKEACCACGGGKTSSAAPSEIPSEPPSEMPSAAPSEIPSEPPSEMPSASPSKIPQETCIDYPPDWAADYYYNGIPMPLACSDFENWIINFDMNDYYCETGPQAQTPDQDNDLKVKDACCICGGGKTVDPEQESNWFITYDNSLLDGDTLTSTYKTKDGVGQDYEINLTDGACVSGSSGGTPHDGSVFSYLSQTIPVDNAPDSLYIEKDIDAAAIVNDHGGTFVFCEKVALTDKNIDSSETYEVVYAKTQYTITATFLADINSYFVLLEDDTSISYENQDLSLTGTVVVTRCNGVSEAESLKPGEELCLEISETSSDDIGVDSINKLILNQGEATFAAITDGVNQHPNLVEEPTCADGACTLDITVPSFMYQDSSGSDTVTMEVSGDVYLYDMSSKNGKAEVNSFSLSVKLEKPCEGGLLGSIAKMFSK